MKARRSFQVLVPALVLATAIPASAQLGTGEFLARGFEHDGSERTYTLYIPESYDGTENWPLVVSFHGFDMTASTGGFKSQPLFDAFSLVADTAEFLVAYPQGLLIRNAYGISTGWNVDGSFGDWDDVKFVERLIDHVSSDHSVDRRRVHATGFSFGGMMSFATACRLSHRVASIGAVAGPMMEKYFVEGCPGTNRPVSVLEFHGTADGPFHPYDGIPLQVDPYAPRPVPETLSWWARHNNCSLDSLVVELPDVEPTDGSTVTRIDYPDCDGGAEVVHYRVEGGGHTWPGNGRPGAVNEDISATTVIWDFLRRHSLPYGTQSLNVDVEMAEALVADPGRYVGIVGSSHPLEWQIPYRLYNGGGGHVYGAAVAFPDNVAGPIDYRFVHYDPDGTGLVEEWGGSGNRTLELSGEDQLLPVVFWNNENEQTPDQPLIVEPEDGGVSFVDVALRWQPGTIGGHYDVEVAEGEDFGSPVFALAGLAQTASASVSLPDSLKLYHWRVRASNVTGLSEWTTGSFFTLGLQAQVLEPLDGLVLPNTTTSVQLRWWPYPGAASYSLQVGSTPDLDAVRPTTEPSTEYLLSLCDYPTPVYWRVKAQNSLPSETRSIVRTAMCVGIESDTEMPMAFALHQNYPNPFNPKTTISYELPQATDVTLTVIDVLGRTIRQLASGTKPAGLYEVSFDATGLPSAVYFYRLQAGDYVETRRMVVVRWSDV